MKILPAAGLLLAARTAAVDEPAALLRNYEPFRDFSAFKWDVAMQSPSSEVNFIFFAAGRLPVCSG